MDLYYNTVHMILKSELPMTLTYANTVLIWDIKTSEASDLCFGAKNPVYGVRM